MIEFKVSSYCTFTECVAVGINQDGNVVVADTKHPQKPFLELTPAEWSDFVAGVKAGKFDL